MDEKLGAVHEISPEALGENRKGLFSGRVIGELGSKTLIANPYDKGVLSDGAGVTEGCKAVVGESSSESVTSGIDMSRSRISNIHSVSRNRVVEMPSQDDEWRSTKSVICMVERLLQGKFGLHYEEYENNFEKERQENRISGVGICGNDVDRKMPANATSIYVKALGKEEDSVDVAVSSSGAQEQDALVLYSNREEKDGGLCLASNQEEQYGLDLRSNLKAQDGFSLASTQEKKDCFALASIKEGKCGFDVASHKEEHEGLNLGCNQDEKKSLALGSNQEEQDHEMENIGVTNATEGALIPKNRGEHDVTEKDGEYYIADLVWGKVRGHPWWPGMIFVPSAASDRAQRYFKRDSYLIAYFGDQSFAWNEASKIKPFQMFFSEMENEGTGEKFSHAVDSALDEFSRRIELGLSCPCLPTEFYEKIKTEVIENAGIRKESSQVSGGDSLSTAALFQPGELVRSLQLFAESPLSNANRLQFMKVKAQLSTFSNYRFKRHLPVLEQFDAFFEGENLFTVQMGEINSDNAMDKLLAELGSEVAVAVSSKKRKSTNQTITSQKRRRHSEAGADSRLEENCLSKLISLNSTILNGGNTVAVKIHKVANSQKPRKMVPAKVPALDVVFKNLTLVAKSPIQKHHVIGAQIRRFLCQFRSAVCIGEPRSRKSKEKQLDVMETTSTEGLQGTGDSYWTDRIIEGPQDQVLFGLKTLQQCDMSSKPGASGYEVVSVPEIRTGDGTELQSDATGITMEVDDRKQGDASIWNMLPEIPSFVVNGYPKEHSNPTSLTLYFADSDSIPSVEILNQVFSCYGPLDELGTEIISERKSAKVVFKSQVDAEAAYISSEKYVTFLPSLVHCSLGFGPQAL